MRRTIFVGFLGILGAMFMVTPSEACELFHFKRIKPVDPCPVGPVASLCWTGCPLRISGEEDTGKGRMIIKKGDGQASVQAVITFERNLDTGIEYEHTMTRETDYTCNDLASFDPALALRVDLATPFPTCSRPDFKMKFVKPRVCADQTFNCSPRNQRSLKVFHDWDAIDDLGQGIPVVRDGTTFKHSATSTLNVWFEVCCGNVSDFGSSGDAFETDTYAVIRDRNGTCITEKLREGKRNSGDPLPYPDVDPCS